MTAPLYYASGMLLDNEIWVSTSTESLVAGIISHYSATSPHEVRARIRHEFMLSAAGLCQEGLIQQAIDDKTWDPLTAPAYERDRLSASKAGRADRGGAWNGVVPLILVMPRGSRQTRAERATVAGNVLLLDSSTPARLLHALSQLGMISAGRVNSRSSVVDPYR